MSAPASSATTLWLLACLLCALGGVFLGRQSHSATASTSLAPTRFDKPAASARSYPSTVDETDVASGPTQANRR
jgi:hypothetical protein